MTSTRIVLAFALTLCGAYGQPLVFVPVSLPVGSGGDDRPNLEAALQWATAPNAGKVVVIVFPAGARYEVRTRQGGPVAAHIVVSPPPSLVAPPARVIILGNGSVVSFHLREFAGLLLDRHQAVVIRDLQFTYDKPAFTQGRITAVYEGAQAPACLQSYPTPCTAIDVAIDPGYPNPAISGGDPFFSGQTVDLNIIPFSSATGELKRGCRVLWVNNRTATQSWIQMVSAGPPTTIRVVVPTPIGFELGSFLAHGIEYMDTVTISCIRNDGSGISPSAFHAFGCSGLHLENIKVTRSPFQGIVATGCSRLEIVNCTIEPETTEARLSTNRDGIFCSQGVRSSSVPLPGAPAPFAEPTTSIVRCQIRNTGDDAISLVDAIYGVRGSGQITDPAVSAIFPGLSAPLGFVDIAEESFGTAVDLSRSLNRRIEVEVLQKSQSSGAPSLRLRGRAQVIGFFRAAGAAPQTTFRLSGAYFTESPTVNSDPILGPPLSAGAFCRIYLLTPTLTGGDPAASGPSAAGDYLSLLSTQHDEYIVDSCVLQDIRGRGIYATGLRGQITNNDIAVVAKNGILVAPDLAVFRHAGFCDTVNLEGNRIAHVAYSRYLTRSVETNLGGICVGAAHSENTNPPTGLPALWPPGNAHDAVTFWRNSVIYCGVPAFFVSNAASVSFGYGGSIGGSVACAPANPILSPMVGGACSSIAYLLDGNYAANTNTLPGLMAPTLISPGALEGVGSLDTEMLVIELASPLVVAPNPLNLPGLAIEKGCGQSNQYVVRNGPVSTPGLTSSVAACGFDPVEGFADISGLVYFAADSRATPCGIVALNQCYLIQPELRDHVSASRSALPLYDPVDGTVGRPLRDRFSRGQLAAMVDGASIVLAARSPVAQFGLPGIGISCNIARVYSGFFPPIPASDFALIVEHRPSGQTNWTVAATLCAGGSSVFFDYPVFFPTGIVPIPLPASSGGTIDIRMRLSAGASCTAPSGTTAPAILLVDDVTLHYGG